MKLSKHHIIVIYDSVFNSVFESQVVIPLQSLSKHTTIISFENNIPKAQQYISKYKHIQFKFLQKNYFVGMWSLYPSSLKLGRILKQFDSYTLTARGPLAGYICLQAQTSKCNHITIQARGLLAEEYSYVHTNQSWIVALRTYMYHQLEQWVYSQTMPKLIFQAVSPELKKYLMHVFNTNEQHITVADHDIPQSISCNVKKEYNLKIRNELNLSADAYIICYNGSAHSWQCPEKIISYFENHVDKKNYVLLLLTHNTQVFKALLEDYRIKSDRYRILNVEHKKVMNYLLACNEGIIFRKPHPINWVSRPTKALEYHAAGLTIIHNNTVAYLTDTLQQQPNDHC